MSGFVSHFTRVLLKRGPRFFVDYISESLLFDLVNGTNTAARVPKDKQHIAANSSDERDGLLYVASFTSVSKRSLEDARRILGEERFQNAQFMDLGCGKGKALIVYAQMFGGTPPAIGIEYDGHLAELAAENLKRVKLGEDRVRVVRDSATNVCQYLTGDTAIIYLYNSFQGETLAKVLGELAETPHILIYVDPVEEKMIQDAGYAIHKRVSGRYNANTWLLASRGCTPGE